MKTLILLMLISPLAQAKYDHKGCVRFAEKANKNRKPASDIRDNTFWCNKTDKLAELEMIADQKLMDRINTEGKLKVKNDLKSGLLKEVCPDVTKEIGAWKFTDKGRANVNDKEGNRLFSIILAKEECL